MDFDELKKGYGQSKYREPKWTVGIKLDYDKKMAAQRSPGEIFLIVAAI